MRQPSTAATLAAVAALPATLLAADIVQVDPMSLTTSAVDDFNDLGPGPANHDDVLVRPGFSLAERFVGQTQGADGDFDVIKGLPSGPLTLQVGNLGENLSVFDAPEPELITVVAGNGPVGYPDFDSIGEGAVAILFEEDQFELGLDVEGADAGCVSFEFYRRDGSFIDSVFFCGAGNQSYAFRQVGNVADIAGVLITNTDPWGLGYDNIRYVGDGVCGADLNGDGQLDILDFVAFQGAFVAGDPGADCNGDGMLDIVDFVCYQGLFTQGCE